MHVCCSASKHMQSVLLDWVDFFAKVSFSHRSFLSEKKLFLTPFLFFSTSTNPPYQHSHPPSPLPTIAELVCIQNIARWNVLKNEEDSFPPRRLVKKGAKLGSKKVYPFFHVRINFCGTIVKEEMISLEISKENKLSVLIIIIFILEEVVVPFLNHHYIDYFRRWERQCLRKHIRRCPYDCSPE